MDDLLEDGNVSQGAAMDVFATLFVVFILILVVSMVLHGGYSIDRDKGFVYARYWVENLPATSDTPVFQLHVHDQASSDARAWIVVDESGREITQTSAVALKTLGVGGAEVERAFIVQKLPASSYFIDLVLHRGFEDLTTINTTIKVCWELFLPLKAVENGCDTVLLKPSTSTLVRRPVEHDLSLH